MTYNYVRSPRLLATARDQSCTHCGVRDGTVVAAHSNQLQHGKGKSLKAHDCFTAWLCCRCHDFADGRSGVDPLGLYRATRADRQAMWTRAFDRTLVQLWLQGLIRMA